MARSFNFRIFVTILVVLQSVGIPAQRQAGSYCTFQYTGAPGVCKLSTNCPQAKKQAEVGIKPTICSFQGNLPIVCCEETGEVQPNENSFLDADLPNGADIFSFPDDNLSSNSADVCAEKCKEYSSPLNKQVQVISLTAHAEPTSINITKCDHAGVPLIVGGKPAEDGEFPHMAAIGFRDADGVINWNCGGTLISDRYVVSAAHCASSRDGPPVKIRLGVSNIHKNLNTRQDFNIEKIIRHPQYIHAEKYNDIVLFKLDKPVRYTSMVRPACLWSGRDITSANAIATGWGRVEFGGSASDTLLKVTLQIFSNRRCENTYRIGTKGLPRGIVETMLCAGDLKGGRDTCSGDSGGPLLITKKNNQCVFYLVGITSFGRHCAAPNTPAIYTRVSSYVDWIVQTIW